MGLEDTFSFSATEYAEKISDYPLEKLRTQERIKHRQHVSSGGSVGGGIGLAPFTFGLSLIGSVYGGRRLYVAAKKLELIQAELNHRNVEHYEPTKRDFFIPFTIGLVALGLGTGVDALATHATSTIAAHVVADHGSRAVHDVLQSPGSFAHGIEQGISTQTHEVADIFTAGVQHAAAAASSDSTMCYLVAGAQLADPGNIVGVAAGASIAQALEAKVASYAAGEVALRFVNCASSKQSQAITMLPPSDECLRIKRPSPSILCDHCPERINPSTTAYYHCCGCLSDKYKNPDDYDACEKCIKSLGRGCRNPTQHILHRILPTGTTNTCRRFQAPFSTSPLSSLCCEYCLKAIAQADYYHCCDCCNDDFDICSDCYDAGKRCHDGEHESLTLLPEPRPTGTNIVGDLPPWKCRRRDRAVGALLSCNHCQDVFNSTAVSFLHCCECKDDFDICMSCGLKGLRCEEKEHKLYIMGEFNTH